jgi:cytochrome c5
MKYAFLEARTFRLARESRDKYKRASPSQETKERPMKLLACTYLAAAILIATGAAQAADGQAAYNADCGVCHNNLDPKIGDKDAWAPLIKKGTDALVASVIKGKGSMPPRAGRANLSDDDIKASTEYLESKSQ